MFDTVILIDGAYFEKAKKNLGINSSIDLVKFSDKLCGTGKRFRTYYYDALPWMPPENPTERDKDRLRKKQRFLQKLNLLPKFEVRLGKLEKRGPSDFKQKGVDVLISIDLVNFAWSDDIKNIILVAGDSDFLPAVKMAKNIDTLITLCYADVGTTKVHNSIFENVDERIKMNKHFFEGCTLNK